MLLPSSAKMIFMLMPCVRVALMMLRVALVFVELVRELVRDLLTKSFNYVCGGFPGILCIDIQAFFNGFCGLQLLASRVRATFLKAGSNVNRHRVTVTFSITASSNVSAEHQQQGRREESLHGHRLPHRLLETHGAQPDLLA